MELYSSENNKIQSVIKEWLENPDRELESSFGENGVVESTTFMNIALRLRSKGYEAVPQKQYMNIMTPSNIRITLEGLATIQQYCRDDEIQNKEFTAMVKDRSTGTDSSIDIEEYGVRFKIRREVPLEKEDSNIQELMSGWSIQDKAFRVITRWSFIKDGVRIDMSVVHSTPSDRRGFRWTKSFMRDVLKQVPRYEVEAEVLRGADTDTPEKVNSTLIRAVGDVLRAVHKNHLLIRKTAQKQVIEEYSQLMGSNRFRGVQPITLEKGNMVSKSEGAVSIRKEYNVTDKADGLRVLVYCNPMGELFMIDMSMSVYRTGLQNPAGANSLLDGEYVQFTKDGTPIRQLLLFDAYKSGGEDVSRLPFAVQGDPSKESRIRKIDAWTVLWKSATIVSKHVNDLNRLQVAVKTFEYTDPADIDSIFKKSARVLDSHRIYKTDGLIFTPMTLSLPEGTGETFYEQFKWKPIEDNTIDFLINYEKDPDSMVADKIVAGIHPDTGETVRYKTMRLYVGSEKHSAFGDPRTTILEGLSLPERRGKRGAYQPVLFNPSDFPDIMANTCYMSVVLDSATGDELVTTESHEPINDRSIVEMRYDPTLSPGWRWIPVRIRHDKTERLQRGQIARTMNNDRVANSIWNSINDPVTLSMIRTGAEEPSADENKMMRLTQDKAEKTKYYDRTASTGDLMYVRGMRDFHNQYIKDSILYRTAFKDGGTKKLIDVACGKAGDLHRWRKGGAGFVLGVDISADNIKNPIDGAYRRYMDSVIEYGADKVPPSVFVIGNSSLPLVTGDAGATPEERDLLRSLFGKKREGGVPKVVAGYGDMLAPGADICSCMFALHYFFENESSLDGIIRNIADTVKVGGYFIGCSFDGSKVFDLLKNTKKGESYLGMHGNVLLWSIAKQYDNEELVSDAQSIGMAIDVEFVSIGTVHREYLVSFDYFKTRMAAIGFYLNDEPGYGSALFGESHKRAATERRRFAMEPAVEEFSFLNRWFVFKRRSVS